MSGTQTVVHSLAVAAAQSYTVAAEYAYKTAATVVQHYGLKLGILESSMEDVMHGLRVWISLRQLKAVKLELLDGDGKLVQKFELPFDISTCEMSEDIFETQEQALAEFLAQDCRQDVRSYRFLADTVSDRADVRGWKRTKAKDDSHLRRLKLTDKLFGSKFVRMEAYVYTSSLPPAGEPS